MVTILPTCFTWHTIPNIIYVNVAYLVDAHHVDVDLDLAILEMNVKVIFLMGRLLLHLGYVRTCKS